MKRFQRIRNAVAACSAALLAISFSPASAEPGHDLLDRIPKDAAIGLCFNQMETSMNNLGRYLQDIAPMQRSIEGSILPMLGMMLDNPQLKGFDVKGSMGLFAVMNIEEFPEQPMPMEDMMTAGVLIPVTDYAAFIQNCAIFKTAAPKGISKAVLPPNKSLLAASSGSFALLSLTDDEEAFSELAAKLNQEKGLKGSLDMADLKEASTQSVWFYANMQKVNKLFGPKIDEAFTAGISMMQAGLAAQGQSMEPNMLKAVMHFYKKLLDKVLKESSYMTFGLHVVPDLITARTAIKALPNTDMASLMKQGKTSLKKSGALNYLSDGAVITAAGVMNSEFLEKAGLAFIDLFAEMSPDKDGKKGTAEMKELMRNFSGAMGDSFAVSMRSEKKAFPFVMDYFYAIKDEKLYDKSMNIVQTMLKEGKVQAFYKNLGMDTDIQMKRGADTYKGTSIDSLNITMKQQVPLQPPEDFLQPMLGGPMEGSMAVVNGMLLYTQGKKATDHLKGLIDREKAGGPKEMGREIRQAWAYLPAGADPDVFMTYNFIRLMKMSASMMLESKDPAQQREAAAMMEAFGAPTKSSLIFTGSFRNARGSMDILVPKQHVLEIMDGFLSMQPGEQRASLNTSTR